MPFGLLAAIGTALCYGIGSVLQAAAASAAPTAEHLDPRLLLTLARGWRYPVGLALDGAGFLLTLVALRTLPLYLVQSVAASFLAVTAVAGALMLGLRLRRQEAGALVLVLVGLGVVGLSAAPQHADALGTGTQWLVLFAAVAVAAATAAVTMGRGQSGAWVLGGLAGVAFGVVAVAGRTLSSAVTGDVGADVHLLLRSPATYAIAVATPLALTAYATALQRGTVVEATVPLVVGETVLPAVAGLLLLGDHTRHGWEVPATLGFVIAVGACLLLARYGEVAPVE
jgi:drug/metabolite transporter (DMT)-like permease